MRLSAGLAAIAAFGGSTTSVSASSDPATVAAQVAASVTAGACPGETELATLAGWRADFAAPGDAGARRLAEFYRVLATDARVRGMPLDAAWTAAAAAPATSPASEALRWLSGCFGAYVSDAPTYKTMVDAVSTKVAAAPSELALGGVTASLGEIVAFLTTTPAVLQMIPVEREAHLTTTDPLTSEQQTTVMPAAGMSGTVDESALGTNATTSTAGTGAQVEGIAGSAAGLDMIGRPTSGWAYFEEKLIMYGYGRVVRLYSIYNEIEWHWDYKAKRVSRGSEWDDWDVDFNQKPIVFWDFAGWKRDQGRYDTFLGHSNGEWYHKLTGKFVLYVISPWGYITLRDDFPYINLYGHYDGGASHYEGSSQDEWTYCQGPGASEC